MEVSSTSIIETIKALTGLPISVVNTNSRLVAVDGLFQIVYNCFDYSLWNVGNGQYHDDGSDVIVGYVLLLKGHEYHNEP